MLRIKLGARRYVGDEESTDHFLPREHAGWDPTLTDEEVYEAARGWWRLSSKANSEKYAMIVCGDTIRLLVAIDEWASRGTTAVRFAAASSSPAMKCMTGSLGSLIR